MAKLFGREKELPLAPSPEQPQAPVEQPVAVPEVAPAAPEQQPIQEAVQPVQQEQQQLGAVRSQQQPAADPTQQPAQKTELRKDIEKMMSDGLADVYQSMTPQEQAAFRAKGEEVASTIEVMVSTFHARAKQVVALIREWLKLIPGVNKYFLEQESKLKTDDIMKYQRLKKAEDRKNRFF